ncbi:kelch domain-containing protein 10-like [Uloborus diversus]|uniref:kelch domain-containing protein 10-like n=1 Tax=Uloborus diversus TaxID=327109 RepID=UPI002409340E|nr:kelch domain-containing protein 10-like [Uloborus diversus]
MSLSVENSREIHRLKRRTKRLFKFNINKVTKLEPSGNRRKGSKCPEPRSGHRIVVYNGNVYAFGGFNPSIHDDDTDGEQHQVLFKELWRFNFAAKNWTRLETTGTMPDQLASHAAALVNNCMIVYGGTGVPFGESSSNSTHVCNLDKLEWQTLPTTGYLPLEQYGQAITVHDGKMYAIGGTTGYTYSMTAHCLNLITREWTLIGSDKIEDLHHDPAPRYRHEIAVYDNQIFVFGGGTASETYGFKEIPVLNLTTNTWRYCASSDVYPPARKCHGCVQRGSDVFICGGLDGSQIFSDVWKINLKSLQWEKLKTQLPTPVYFHSTALSPAGQIIIFGGVSDLTQNVRSNELYSVWIKIPPLAEMCWQAILTYIPNIALLERQKLVKTGIPIQYINQIEFSKSSEIENKNCCKLLS